MGKEINNRISLYKKLITDIKKNVSEKDQEHLKLVIKDALKKGIYNKDKADHSRLETVVNTVLIIINEIGLRNTSVIATLLYYPFICNIITLKRIEELFDSEVVNIIKGLKKVRSLEYNQNTLASENYISLLLSFAEDIRVVLIMIANRLYLMRNAQVYDEQFKLRLSIETSYLYTPLAHKLGLYKIKSEMEDLYLKYTDRETYDYISQKINETKASRDKYIAEFIAPIEEKLKKSGLKYDIKGRTKSIFSINNKLKKQKIDFESIYDLFAIRIILDSPLEKEKAECWQVYSIVTDLYQPNPKRLKDWLSIPKSNGYESLHITVMGPESKWVEVQIRTHRMDEIAERGFAAHWKYKGLKSQENLDDWLTNLRETLENKNLNTEEKLQDFKLDIYDDEIYVFTPKGDLHKLPKGATVLDFAFSIHSKLGTTCVSGKVNGKNESIRHKLNNGDQIDIVTSPNQTPKRDWLKYVVTSKAKNKIRQSLKEEANKQVNYAKEQLKRRMKNRKIEEDEAVMMRLIKKMGFKTVTDFYVKIAEESLDINNVIDQYVDLEKKEAEIRDKHEITSAENFTIQTNETDKEQFKDELILDKNLTGVDYKLARCCNPIFGDEIFGFVSSQGIKIHRKNCPNAHDMFSRFGYRIIPARWSGKSESSYIITLRVVGIDDIGIVTNLTSIISKEQGVTLRAINIDSNDGLFQGNISVLLNNTDALNVLIKKLKTVKGVKQINRIN
ncbi:MAG: RelA/SpoT family protein [Dysgonomonas sp.]